MLELKHVACSFGKDSAVISQSHHAGIETRICKLNSLIVYYSQSHHAGIETVFTKADNQ